MQLNACNRFYGMLCIRDNGAPMNSSAPTIEAEISFPS